MWKESEFLKSQKHPGCYDFQSGKNMSEVDFVGLFVRLQIVVQNIVCTAEMKTETFRIQRNRITGSTTTMVHGAQVAGHEEKNTATRLRMLRQECCDKTKNVATRLRMLQQNWECFDKTKPLFLSVFCVGDTMLKVRSQTQICLHFQDGRFPKSLFTNSINWLTFFRFKRDSGAEKQDSQNSIARKDFLVSLPVNDFLFQDHLSQKFSLRTINLLDNQRIPQIFQICPENKHSHLYKQV